MRVIKIFFLSLLAIFLLGLVFILAGREIFLIRASSDIKQAANYLRKNASLSDCQDGFAISKDVWSQLRFKNESEYNLEAVCSDFVQKPVLKAERKLPVFVKKIAGASGFELNDDENPQFITLQSFGRQIHLYLDGQELKTSYTAPPDLDYDSGPASSCQAFNYQCCQNDVQVGVGDSIGAASDCPKSCYQDCQARPLILSLNARPVADENKIVSLRSGQTGTFSYVISDGKQELFGDQLVSNADDSLVSKIIATLQQVFTAVSSDKAAATQPITARLDFGDGQAAQSQKMQDSLEHTYTCSTKTCYYELNLTATDALGVPTVQNELSKLTVKVER